MFKKDNIKDTKKYNDKNNITIKYKDIKDKAETEIIKEGLAKIKIYKGKISKKLQTFYNPVMKLNRDLTILVLNSVENKDMQIADILAGTGIRSIRFLLELKKEKIKNISINDYKTKKDILKNLALNNLNSLKEKNIFVYEKDAVKFLLDSYGFDYIDIDPFGSPNPFLESSILRISRNGILAVTATDTAALSGNSENACLRKYFSKPLKNEFMHETGIRILIRKVQLIGSQYEKALIPIFSFYKDHYYRVFFKCEKGRQKSDEIIKDHKFLLYNWKTSERKIIDKITEINNYNEWDYTGPIWTGKLWQSELIEKMLKNAEKSEQFKNNKELINLLKIINQESKINSIGYYDLHYLAKIKKIQIPKIDTILNEKTSRTHFLDWGIRCEKLEYKNF
ncbi:MAG: hypothetical protein QXM96_03070 [Candidatus Woesearchaeota archaeon]